MELQQDTIADIAEAQIGYFGGPGRMLLPSVATVAVLVASIPRGSVMATAQLRRELADQFHVQGTCPVTTKKALKAIANDNSGGIPWWRVVKANGELMAFYPGGVEGQAERLRGEGVRVEVKGKGLVAVV